MQTVIVAHGADRERPNKLRSLAPAGIPVVMSSQAWADYRVPGSPYFVLVDGGIRGEGVATTWQALSSLVSDAIEDQRDVDAGTAPDARDAEATLAAAGIGPEHPSLYPGRRTVTLLLVARLRGRRDRGGRVRVVALRRVDAGEHHPAR